MNDEFRKTPGYQAMHRANEIRKVLGEAAGFGASCLGGTTGTDFKSAWKWAMKYVENGTGVIGAVIPAGPGKVRIVIVHTRKYVLGQIETYERKADECRKLLGLAEKN